MCEYCEFPSPKNLSYRRDDIYREFIRLDHLLKSPMRKEEAFIIEANCSGANIYATIHYCPMCGRKLED
jgi:hypothetical protein